MIPQLKLKSSYRFKLVFPVLEATMYESADPCIKILFNPVTSGDLFIFGLLCCHRSTHPCLLRETDAWKSFITGLARELHLFFLHAAGNSPSGSCDLLMGHYQQRGAYHV
jgi:hypothetical protein